MKEKLVELLGSDVVADAPEILEAHAGDKWFASNPPEVVVFAETTEQVSKLLKFASANKIPVTARGAGFGYVGGCVPVRGGIALSLARMNRIKEINFADVIAIVEPTPWTDKSPNNRAPQLISWVQATNLGVDAHSDSDTLTV